MIWFAFAFLTSIVILVITRPLLRSRAAQSNPALELEVYKLQLTEVEREAERGTLSDEEAKQTQTEIARRLLRLTRKSPAAFASKADSANMHALFAGLAFAVSVGALCLYLYYGRPGLADQPLEARLNAPPEKQSVEIQIANVERRLRANPNDARGWAVIAPVYFRMNQFEKSAEAYRRAILLAGPSEDKLLGLGEALTFANGGVIPDAARTVFDLAVKANPKSERGRFWLALLAEQEGRKQDAVQAYRAMLSENTSEDWKNLLRERLSRLESSAPNAQKAPGTEEQAQASTDVLQGKQGEMIRGMVEGLAARLKEDGSDLEGWLKLIRSYSVLKETAKAGEAIENARRQFAANADALAKIDALQRNLGLEAPSSDGARAKP